MFPVPVLRVPTLSAFVLPAVTPPTITTTATVQPTQAADKTIPAAATSSAVPVLLRPPLLPRCPKITVPMPDTSPATRGMQTAPVRQTAKPAPPTTPTSATSKAKTTVTKAAAENPARPRPPLPLLPLPETAASLPVTPRGVPGTKGMSPGTNAGRTIPGMSGRAATMTTPAPGVEAEGRLRSPALLPRLWPQVPIPLSLSPKTLPQVMTEPATMTGSMPISTGTAPASAPVPPQALLPTPGPAAAPGLPVLREPTRPMYTTEAIPIPHIGTAGRPVLIRTDPGAGGTAGGTKGARMPNPGETVPSQFFRPLPQPLLQLLPPLLLPHLPQDRG